MMKLRCTALIAAAGTALFVLAPAVEAPAWDGTTHGYVARAVVHGGTICTYNARMGSLVPDFAWYLRDGGFVNKEEAQILHATVFWLSLGRVGWWDYGLRCFVAGTGTHLCADEIAHGDDGPIAQWSDALFEAAPGYGEEAQHLAVEFAVGALVIDKYGFQLWDLLYAYRQAAFVERVVEGILEGDRGDLALEFKKYLGLGRALEKAAAVYLPYLKGDAPFLGETDMDELLEAAPELSQESLAHYLEVLELLLIYPEEIHGAVTGDPDWENVLSGVTDGCR